MRRYAVMSTDLLYRFVLGREPEPDDELWRPGLKGHALFVLNNPSIADDQIDDATCRRGVGFTVAWGYATMTFANTNPYRSTKPSGALLPPESVLLENDRYLRELAIGASVVVAAWGDKARQPLAERALQVLRGVCVVQVLALTKTGIPRHPLYLKGDLRPQPWNRGSDS